MKSEQELFEEARDALERWANINDDQLWQVRMFTPPCPVLLTGIEFDTAVPLLAITRANVAVFTTPPFIKLGVTRVGFKAVLIPGQNLVVTFDQAIRARTTLIWSEDALRERIRAEARKTS